MDVTGEAEEGFIKLSITYPHILNLNYNFKLIIDVGNQKMNGPNSTIITKTIFIPEKNISVGPLDGGKIYKVICKSIIGGDEYNKVIFVFVGSWENKSQISDVLLQEESISQFQQNKQSFQQASNIRPNSKSAKEKVKISEGAYSNSQDLMRMVGRSVGITNEKTLQRFILKGRNCRNVQEFTGKRGKESLKKKEMVVKGKIILNQVYQRRQGMQFFKNDWFMGPFYSYNHNEKQLSTNQ